jgi:hypothetical protein
VHVLACMRVRGVYPRSCREGLDEGAVFQPGRCRRAREGRSPARVKDGGRRIHRREPHPRRALYKRVPSRVCSRGKVRVHSSVGPSDQCAHHPLGRCACAGRAQASGSSDSAGAGSGICVLSGFVVYEIVVCGSTCRPIDCYISCIFKIANASDNAAGLAAGRLATVYNAVLHKICD